MNDTPLPFTVWAMIAMGRPSPRPRRGEDVEDRGHVVAVDLEHAPAEGRPLGDQLARDLRRRSARPVRRPGQPYCWSLLWSTIAIRLSRS